MPRRKSKPSIWPKILVLLIVCLIVGAGTAFVTGTERGRELTSDVRIGGVKLHNEGAGVGKSAAETGMREARQTREEVDGLSRDQLERQVIELRETVANKDREIADLTIQLKLLEEGSRTR